jgi:YfiR/HmsC-like
MAAAVIRRLTAGIVTLSCVLTLAPAMARQGQPQTTQILEAQVKAAFVYNFLNFIEWPASAFKRADEPFRVCVVGSDPVSEELVVTVRGETVAGRKILLERLKDESDGGFCRVLFVPLSEEIRLPSLMRATARRGVLVVGESPRVLDACGSIALVVEDSRVRFDVNMAALRSQNLKVSSKLLRVARARTNPVGSCGS